MNNICRPYHHAIFKWNKSLHEHYSDHDTLIFANPLTNQVGADHAQFTGRSCWVLWSLSDTRGKGPGKPLSATRVFNCHKIIVSCYTASERCSVERERERERYVYSENKKKRELYQNFHPNPSVARVYTCGSSQQMNKRINFFAPRFIDTERNAFSMKVGTWQIK